MYTCMCMYVCMYICMLFEEERERVDRKTVIRMLLRVYRIRAPLASRIAGSSRDMRSSLRVRYVKS